MCMGAHLLLFHLTISDMIEGEISWRFIFVCLWRISGCGIGMTPHLPELVPYLIQCLQENKVGDSYSEQ